MFKACVIGTVTFLLIASVAPHTLMAKTVATIPAKNPATKNSATVNTTVEIGKWATARLGNLPAGAFLDINVTANGAIGVILIDGRRVGNFPDVERPLFSGRASRKLKFSITVPRTGTYYVVIDNREGKSRRNVTIDIRATAPKPTARKGAKLFKTQLGAITQTLKQVFTAVPIKIGSHRCGRAEIRSTSTEVIICSEYPGQVIKLTQNKSLAANAMLFILMREVGRIALAHWQHPAAGENATIDGFATTLMIMFGQAERARNQAEYFAAISAGSALHTAWAGAPPLSPDRAKMVLGWIDDSDSMRKWQKFLVPHLRTEYLLRLKQAPKPWTIRHLITRELAGRHTME